MKEPVTYRPFQAQPVLQQGLLPIERDNGDLERRVAAGLARIADLYAGKAEQEAEMKARMDVQRDVYSGAPTPATVTGGEQVATASPNGQAGHVKGAQSGVRVHLPPADVKGAIAQAAAAHGVDAGALTEIARIESGFNPSAQNPASTAGGLFQFINSTARRYGLSNKFDPAQSADAAARLLKDNQAYLTRSLGRAPTTGELYLAHQQGAEGARKLLANPAARAVDVVGLDAVLKNGGTAEMTAGDFAGKWTAKVAGGDSVATLPNRDGPVRVVPVTSPVSVEPGKPGTWRPTGQNTIYGRTYDIEGTRTYLQLAKQTIVQEQAALYDQYKENPAQLKQAYDQLLEQHKREETYFDEIAPEYEHSFTINASAYLTRARSEQLQRQRERDTVDFKDRVSSMEDRKSQLLVGLDPADPNAVTALADAQNDIDNHYDSAVSRGMMGAEDAAAAKRKSRSDMVVGFYTKQAAGKNSADVAALTLKMREDYAAGKLAGVTADDWSAIETSLQSEASRSKSRETQATTALESRRDDIFTKALRGETLTPGEIAQMQTDAATSPDGSSILASMDARLRLASALRSQPIGQVEGGLNEILKRADGSVSAEDVAFARDKIAETKKLLTTDPLGAAEAYGITPAAPPIDLTQLTEPAALRDALAYRRGAALAAARHFGVEPRYFRPGEAQGIVSQAMNNPDAMVAFTNNAISAFGKDAPAAMREISEAGPVMAYSVGVGNRTGDPSIARDVAQVWTMRQRKDYSVKMPEGGTLETKGSAFLSGALAADPQAQVAALQTANLLFEKMAAEQGFDPRDVKKEGSPAEAAYMKALDRALGGQSLGGRDTGGLGRVNDRQIVVPSLMDKERPQELMYQLTDAMLKQLPAMGSANGVAIRARQLRDGYLIPVGDGLYRISLTNPDEEEPELVPDESGRPYVLDMRELDRVASPSSTSLAPSRMDAYREGTTE